MFRPRSAPANHSGGPAALLALSCCCIAASGCGAARSSASDAPSTPAAAAFARAVNLNASDLPEMSQISAEANAPSPGRSGAAFARCDGEASPNLRVASVRSAEFSSGAAGHAQLVSSAVEVLPSPAVAAGNLAAFDSARGRACYVRFLEASNRRRSGALRYGHSEISSLANPLQGAAQSFVRRVTSTLSGTRTDGSRVSLRVYHDTYAFVQGASEVDLIAVGFSAPVPAAAEQRLLGLLYARATVHSP
jgi:hypothetical protein